MREVALVGLTLVVFFIIILFLKRDKQLNDYLLTAFFFCIGFELLFRFLLFSNIQYSSSNFILFDIVYWALFGPILLFYTKSVIDKAFKFNLRNLVHLLPLIISLATVSVYILNKSSYNSFPHFYNSSEGLVKIGLMIWEFASPIYLPFILYILIIHKKGIKDFYSNIERKELNWLFLITLGFTSFVYISDLLWFFTDIFPVSESLKVLSVILTIFVFILGIYGYRQESIFLDVSINSKHSKNLTSTQKAYQKSIIDPIERESINKNLMGIMIIEKPYLESEITINDLANKIGISAYKLSRVINEDFNQNFFDFINTYRVNEVKKQLKDTIGNELKIEAIAYDCGFNSKSSFYSIFKKHTHLTPTEYREKPLVNI